MKNLYEEIKLDLAHHEKREREYYGEPCSAKSRDLELEIYKDTMELIVKLKALILARTDFS